MPALQKVLKSELRHESPVYLHLPLEFRYDPRACSLQYNDTKLHVWWKTSRLQSRTRRLCKLSFQWLCEGSTTLLRYNRLFGDEFYFLYGLQTRPARSHYLKHRQIAKLDLWDSEEEVCEDVPSPSHRPKRLLFNILLRDAFCIRRRLCYLLDNLDPHSELLLRFNRSVLVPVYDNDVTISDCQVRLFLVWD